MAESITQEQQQIITDDKVKKVLTTEIKFVIGIIIFIAGVIAPYYSIREDIALIKENHFSHMETMNGQIKENSDNIKEIKTQELEIIKTMAVHEEKIKTLQQ